MSYQPKVYRKQGGDELVVASGGKITIESGGELELADGSTLDVGDGLSAPADITVADTKIIVGNGDGLGAAVSMSGDATIANTGAVAVADLTITSEARGDLLRRGASAWERVAAKTSGQILVGDGTDIVSVAVSGHATLAANGALTLSNSGGVASLIAGGLGASAAYIKTTNGVQTLLAADAAARVVLLVVRVDEVFATGDTSQTTFKFGETDTDDKYAATTLLTDAADGAVKVLAGTLTANKALLVTAVAAAGTGTGGVSVTAIILPAAV